MKFFKRVLGVIVLVLLAYSMLFITQCRIILEVNSTQKTLNEQRQTAYEVELTAITDRVISINKDLDFWQGIANKMPSLFLSRFKDLERIK